MLKQGTFINKRFNRFVLGCIWGTLAYCINLMTDSIISGNQLGELSLQAVSIVYPLFAVVYFFSYLLPQGVSVLFGKSIGEFKEEYAYRVAGTGVISSILIGILLAAGLWAIKTPFLTYFECTGELLKAAAAYYNWLILFACLQPLHGALLYLLMADGEAVLVSVANITDIAVNIILSILLSRNYGISGLGMATFIGTILYTFILLIHFLKKSNNVKLHVCLDFRILRRSIVLSFNCYMYYLFLAIVDIVLNKIIIANCGMEYIPAYSVVNLVFGVCELFQAPCGASVGFITCFLGEQNNHGINLLFHKLTRATIIMAVCLTVFFFFGAPLMPIIYGLENPITIQAAVMASRVMSFTAFGFGTMYVMGTISPYVEKPMQACFISFLNDVFSPLLLSLLMGSLWGFTGIAVGMCLSPYLAFGLYAVIRIPQKGKAGFPIYVEDYGEEGISFDMYVDRDSIIEIRDAVCAEVTGHGYEIENLDLLIEEFFTRVMEKNPGKRVLSECTLLFGEHRMRIIIRDNGTLFNFIDENNRVESLNAHVLNSLLEQTKEKNYIITTAFNRNEFMFVR